VNSERNTSCCWARIHFTAYSNSSLGCSKTKSRISVSQKEETVWGGGGLLFLLNCKKWKIDIGIATRDTFAGIMYQCILDVQLNHEIGAVGTVQLSSLRCGSCTRQLGVMRLEPVPSLPTALFRSSPPLGYSFIHTIHSINPTSGLYNLRI
jgi:hypothetical protein